MIVFKRAADISNYLAEQKKKHKRIGFVPTMGALHQGHLSLINLSKSTTDITVASVFVNPTQFTNTTDFDTYPVTVAADIHLLETSQCDVLFLPPVSEVYGAEITNLTPYPIGQLEIVLEGAYRPGHFQGVCQVIDKLLSITQPNQLFLGEKDFQQQLIIKNLVKLLYPEVDVVIAATVREPTGLAMSSRNMRLTGDQKEQATAIYKSMQYIKNTFHSGGFGALETRATNYLLQQGFSKVDYVQIANANTLEKVNRWDGLHHLVVLVAATIGSVRLIDNMVLTKA